MLTLVLTLTRVQGDEHVLTNKKRVYRLLTNAMRGEYLTWTYAPRLLIMSWKMLVAWG